MHYIFLLKLVDDLRIRELIGDAHLRETRHLMSAVVIAECEEHARHQCQERECEDHESEASDGESDISHFDHFWRSAAISSCKKVGVADEGKKGKVLLADYVTGF